jgi:hypothetical protein
MYCLISCEPVLYRHFLSFSFNISRNREFSKESSNFVKIRLKYLNFDRLTSLIATIDGLIIQVSNKLQSIVNTLCFIMLNEIDSTAEKQAQTT